MGTGSHPGRSIAGTRSGRRKCFPLRHTARPCARRNTRRPNTSKCLNWPMRPISGSCRFVTVFPNLCRLTRSAMSSRSSSLLLFTRRLNWPWPALPCRSRPMSRLRRLPVRPVQRSPTGRKSKVRLRHCRNQCRAGHCRRSKAGLPVLPLPCAAGMRRTERSGCDWKSGPLLRTPYDGVRFV